MQISELSRQSGVSIPSIKFYLREGLLPAGSPTSANRSEYGELHLRRLRLIRALIDIGELSVANVREALQAVDAPSVTLHDAFGAVMHRLDRSVASDIAAGEVLDWLDARGWAVEPHAPAIRSLADLLVTLRDFDFPLTPADFDLAADFFESAAELDVGYARAQPDRTAAVETMIVGTVVIGRALSDVRRLALEAVSARQERGEAPRPS